MIKICLGCRSTWAGGTSCEACGSPLHDPYAEEAKRFPEDVWKYIRLQYGARRGMLVRVLAIMLGFVVAFFGLRRATRLPSPMRYVAAAGAILLGLLAWRILHVAASRAVRIWILRRGQVHKAKLARAMLKRALD